MTINLIPKEDVIKSNRIIHSNKPKVMVINNKDTQILLNELERDNKTLNNILGGIIAMAIKIDEQSIKIDEQSQIINNLKNKIEDEKVYNNVYPYKLQDVCQVVDSDCYVLRSMDIIGCIIRCSQESFNDIIRRKKHWLMRRIKDIEYQNNRSVNMNDPNMDIQVVKEM